MRPAEHCTSDLGLPQASGVYGGRDPLEEARLDYRSSEEEKDGQHNLHRFSAGGEYSHSQGLIPKPHDVAVQAEC